MTLNYKFIHYNLNNMLQGVLIIYLWKYKDLCEMQCILEEARVFLRTS